MTQGIAGMARSYQAKQNGSVASTWKSGPKALNVENQPVVIGYR